MPTKWQTISDPLIFHLPAPAGKTVTVNNDDGPPPGLGFYELGFCYEFGKGVDVDLEEAEKWYDHPKNNYRVNNYFIKKRTIIPSTTDNPWLDFTLR